MEGTPLLDFLFPGCVELTSRTDSNTRINEKVALNAIAEPIFPP